jgi:hypothetical protein
LMLAVWVLLVWVASRPALKTLFDLTPQNINSVDQATVELLRELRSQKAEIEFHQFYPPYDGQAATDLKRQEFRIREQLREYTRLLLVRYQYLGGESVKLIAHDLYGDPQGTREAAQAFDYRAAENDTLVVAVRMPGKERRYRKLSLLLDLGRIERPNTGGPPTAGVLPILKAFVGEIQISSTLKSLLVEGTPTAYVLSAFSPDLQTGEATGGGYGSFLTALSRLGFDVKVWDPRAEPAVPKDAALVIVLEPRREFPDNIANSLFAYAQRGGRLFLNYSWSSLDDWNPDGGRLGELLGFSLSEQPVFHLIPDASNRTRSGRGLDGDNAVAKLQLGVSRDHPVTRRIAESGRGVEVGAARAIRERPGAPADVKREDLLVTGDQGWLALPGPDGFPSNRAPAIALQSFVVGMACEVPVPEASKPAPGAPKAGHVVIVSGVFCNNTGMQYFGDLALNICNWMAERRVLLDLKAPSYETKYLQLQPQQLARIGNLLIYGIPGLFLALGAVVFFVRRRQ